MRLTLAHFPLISWSRESLMFEFVEWISAEFSSGFVDIVLPKFAKV
jgi:hypothetical protein